MSGLGSRAHVLVHFSLICAAICFVCVFVLMVHTPSRSHCCQGKATVKSFLGFFVCLLLSRQSKHRTGEEGSPPVCPQLPTRGGFCSQVAIGTEISRGPWQAQILLGHLIQNHMRSGPAFRQSDQCSDTGWQDQEGWQLLLYPQPHSQPASPSPAPPAWHACFWTSRAPADGNHTAQDEPKPQSAGPQRAGALWKRHRHWHCTPVWRAAWGRGGKVVGVGAGTEKATGKQRPGVGGWMEWAGRECGGGGSGSKRMGQRKGRHKGACRGTSHMCCMHQVSWDMGLHKSCFC